MQRNRTTRQLIDKSLHSYGVESRENTRKLVRRARAHSNLTDDQALTMAQNQVRAVRRKS